jgi:phosphoribosylpyrophosphate synthetase
MIRTGKTIREQSQDLKRKGARNIYCFGFHGLCTNDQFEKLINELPVKELIMTNSIQHSIEVLLPHSEQEDQDHLRRQVSRRNHHHRP